MIIVETKMKRIPSRCTNCKYSFCARESGWWRHCSLVYCDGFPKEIPKPFVPELKNYVYLRPEWCPLKEINDDM